MKHSKVDKKKRKGKKKPRQEGSTVCACGQGKWPSEPQCLLCSERAAWERTR